MTPVGLFAALTRAVREEHMREEVRSAAFCGLERLAVRLDQPTYAHELEQFVGFAKEHAGLAEIIQRFLPALEALANGAGCPIQCASLSARRGGTGSG